MTANSIVVTCEECGTLLDEDQSTPTESRKPCPKCGSLNRHVNIQVHDTVNLREKLRMKGRDDAGKPFIEQVHGDSLHRKSRKWMKLNRIIDRAKDWYHELVIDPETGETVHECQEPLSQHRGHGSAKRSQNDSGVNGIN
jgi:phage FluMu protein Com